MRTFSPSKTRNIALGFLAGLVLSFGVITIRFITEDKIRSSEDIETYAGLPTLGAIPMQNQLPGRNEKTPKKCKDKAKKGGAKA